jgi:hypothetical protein
MYGWWLARYITSVDVYIEYKADWLAGSVANDAEFWIDKHCRENPLSHVLNCAFQLVDEIRTRE